MQLAARMSDLGTENAFEVLAEVERLRAAGRDVISFAIGEPDFATPDHISAAAVAAIERGETHYAPSAGIAPLRAAIAAYMQKSRGLAVGPEHVVVTPGAKPILYHGLTALLEPGDEVLVPDPGFPIYASVVRFLGGVPVPLPLRETHDFAFDPAELKARTTPRTRGIILNSPQNPTGGVLSRADLEAVAALALANDWWVISDEIYDQLVYDGDFVSIAALPGMAARTVIVGGFSKSYAMTGWRLGYGVMPETLARAIARIVTNCESCTATFIQHAGVAALTGPQAPAQQMVAELKARRDLMVAGLNQLRGVRCLTPRGAFYAFPNVTEACKRLGVADSKAFQQRLLAEIDVAVLPRSAFGPALPDEPDQYVRLSYATGRDQIAAGLERLAGLLGRV
ncbi:MAG TPA: pyridoxal phosphate-dependent aminotransferase [Limnochordia bacterium]|nr:pyridoxal phosphate-dependent aminotransferase [Limnochordia bacterium]